MSAVGMGMGKAVYTALPYAVLTLKFASNAAMMAMLRSTLDPVHGVNPVVLAVYQQLASSCVLVSLALLLDRGRRKPSWQILSWTCLIGFLQITVAELLLTTSLRYITASVQSVGLNTIPVTVFVLAVLAGRENFAWGSSYGQAKLWGVFASVAGATLVVLASDSDSTSGGGSGAFNGFWLGVLMVAASVLVHSVAYMLVERAAIEYSSDLTLSAMMSSFGMIQMVVVAALMVRDLSSWKINRDTLELPIILFGGIIVTGVFYFGHNWCIHTKGPVFGAAFSPLLVVFSFLLEILFFQSKLDIKSVIGAVLVVGGLYLLLWAKTRDHKEKVALIDHSDILESSSTEPLMLQSRA
ncbi:WAT1-related protein [Rhynchospora pubera]|uniref:WAT1-related protein n=1 Tax=Rhynchospora pubera TaxID=906938 RepID=A0AAV8HVF3_9POAL|nr:WAT1-related protein [Rhynchospora pubera]